MALTHTQLLTATPTDTGTVNYTSGSFTPADNSLLAVILTWQHNTGTPSPAISGGGLTWTTRVSYPSPAAYEFPIYIWTAPVSSGSSMTVNITINNVYTGATSIALSVENFTGYDTTTPTGASAIERLGTTDPPEAYNLSLSGTTDSTSITLGVGCADEGTITYDGTWTSIYNGTNGFNNFRYAKKSGSTSVVNYSEIFSYYTLTLAGLEIRAGAESGASPYAFGIIY